ncbi:MAG: cysteine hydrolase [Candidatus Methanoperedens sp.]|nr:cysteine hydrolase [Candidatus Methanoperedens sp.]MCZ7370703.1 cysteine hydrolase [Candidatus Methanoperedens sp.]
MVWDVQNALVNSIFDKDEFLGNLKTVIHAARKRGISIIYTKITPLPADSNSSWSIYIMMKRYGVDDPAKLPEFLKPGTSDADIPADVAPLDNDLVIKKHTASIFIDTHVEYMIRNKGIDAIVFTGISTEFGISSSARDASNRGFYPVVLKDCVSSRDKEMHEASLKALAGLCIVVPFAEVIKEWK